MTSKNMMQQRGDTEEPTWKNNNHQPYHELRVEVVLSQDRNISSGEYFISVSLYPHLKKTPRLGGEHLMLFVVLTSKVWERETVMNIPSAILSTFPTTSHGKNFLSFVRMCDHQLSNSIAFSLLRCSELGNRKGEERTFSLADRFRLFKATVAASFDHRRNRFFVTCVQCIINFIVTSTLILLVPVNYDR